ncbi:hypothetical protein [Methylocystis echinoides]|uniref:Uncharacterized protein n=1 Tax=Methylocystis echinoides TaxID=29468 RepID=A0A9W6GXC4_9HYPH|nr:hypothetical protein [Methylocystis echinoides]GLI94727.1 hypothetical protein LMG27198_37190 [Methylocystis echinoides]
MTIAAAPPGLQPEDYDLIEAALAQTARGRTFLDAYARRTKEAERARILCEIERLLMRYAAPPAPVAAETAHVAAQLLDLSWSLRGRSASSDPLCQTIEALARALESVPWAQARPDQDEAAPAEGAALDDPRRAALSWLDDLPLADRLAIFA